MPGKVVFQSTTDFSISVQSQDIWRSYPKTFKEQAVLDLFGLLGLHKYFNSLEGTAPYSTAMDKMHGAFTDTYLLWGQGVHNYRVHCI